jgi:cytochrome o ubiquinol oxidase operon protein cyoD
MSEKFTKFEVLIFIFGSAIAQFLVQVIFFLRLTTKSPQGKINIMAFIFTGVILTSIICGSLWIMWNLNYNMMH